MALIDTFPNPNKKRNYEIEITCPEFTSLCPKTGQPDFATIRITYTPNAKCIELKSLKIYLQSYRDIGSFHEDVTNKIMDDFIKSCMPKKAIIVGDFNLRGGIKTVVKVEYKKPKKN